MPTNNQHCVMAGSLWPDYIQNTLLVLHLSQYICKYKHGGGKKQKTSSAASTDKKTYF